MNEIANRLNTYIQSHPFDAGDSGCETVLEQLYQAYAESHESDPEEIGDGFKELEGFLPVFLCIRFEITLPRMYMFLVQVRLYQKLLCPPLLEVHRFRLM